MPEIVSDEYSEGWTSFVRDVCNNPYEFNTEQYDDWEAGWLAAQLNWFELVDGGKSV